MPRQRQEQRQGGGLVLIALALCVSGPACDTGEREEARSIEPAPRPGAGGRPRTRGGGSRSAPGFAYRSESPRVTVHADVDLPVDDLRRFCEDVLEELRGWLAPNADPGGLPRYRVYLCREVETMHQLEEWHGIPRFDRRPDRTYDYRGGFYAGVGIVALQADGQRDLRWDLAHELSHAVFNEVVGKGCDALDEGLAEYSSARVLGEEPLGYLIESCAGAVRMKAVPTLENFFGLDYWEFRDERADWRHYGVSWFLVQMLIEDDSPAIAGRFPALLENLRDARDPWVAFQETYEVAAVEARLNETIEERTRWLPAWGSWSLDEQGCVADVRGSGSALLLHRDLSSRGVPFELGYELPQVPGRSWGIGFALGFRDDDDYVIVSLRNREGNAVIAHRGGQRWKSKETIPLDPSVDFTGSIALTLHCDAGGVITVLKEEQELLRYALGVHAFGGSAGIWVEQRHESEFERMTFELERPRFER